MEARRKKVKLMREGVKGCLDVFVKWSIVDKIVDNAMICNDFFCFVFLISEKDRDTIITLLGVAIGLMCLGFVMLMIAACCVMKR